MTQTVQTSRNHAELGQAELGQAELDQAGLGQAELGQAERMEDATTRVSGATQEEQDLGPASVIFPEGKRFDGYVLGRCIGHGGMARIYQAEHAVLRRQVALKVLGASFAKDPEGRERFLREACIVAAVKHPNVVNIFDVGVQEGVPYIAMELLEGVDLDALLENKKPLGEDTVIDFMIPLVAGLSTVHAAGVVHRDLKPANLFLARGPHGETVPKLLDFGISKAAWPEQSKLTLANGSLMGTPLYMSPEALRGEEMTEKSDQYSLGVILYECATGVNPFSAATFAETVRLITSGEYPRPCTQNPEISRRFERVIERALSLDPAQRFADMKELGRELLMLAGQRTRVTWSLSFGEASALEQRLTHRLTAKLAEQRGSATQRPSASPARERRLKPVLVAVIAVALLGAGLLRQGTGVSTPGGAAAPGVGQAASDLASVEVAGAAVAADALAKPLEALKQGAASRAAARAAPASGTSTPGAATPAASAGADVSPAGAGKPLAEPAVQRARSAPARAPAPRGKAKQRRRVGANSAPILD